MDTLLIAIGNRFRRDDGVGPAVVDQLAGVLPAGVDTHFASGEGASLMDAWQGYRRVYLFDAVMSRKAPGAVHRLDASEQAIPQDFFKYSTHAFSLAEAVEMARALAMLPEKLVIFGVEGGDFGSGEGLSDAVAKAVPGVVQQVKEELGVAGEATQGA